MKTRHVPLILPVIVAALIPLSTALAKEVIEMTISGPGLDGRVEVTDPEILTFFADHLFESEVVGPAPEVSDTYYEIRQTFGAEGEAYATNVYHYYPDSEGGVAYVYYADIEGGFSSAEGTWFRVSEEGDRALRNLLAIQGADPTQAPTSPMTGKSLWAAAGLTILLAAGWLARGQVRKVLVGRRVTT